ncbi:MAG: DNA-directed DNA polymerase [Candidatus Nanoarchaeia archaeon]|nr:DNA-directed DNA polymerase [Candidatus Nanoarchaeia archaeon]
MAAIKADILDIKFEENTATVYAVNKKNERIELKDYYEPYYYAEFKSINDSLIKKIKAVKANAKNEIHSPKNAEIVQKRVNSNLKDLVKITASSQKALDAIHYEIKKFKEYSESHERDVELDKKYFFDKKITALKTMEFETDDKGFIKKIRHTDEKRNDYLVLCFDIETYNPESLSNPEKDPAVMISYASSNGKKGVITYKECDLKEAIIEKNEKGMIEKFLQIIKEINPSIIATYNGDNFDLPYLIERAKIMKIPFNLSWDNSGIRISKKALRGISCQTTGLINFDLYPFIATTMGTYLKTETYTLNAVSEELLGEKKEDYDVAFLASHWDANNINDLAKYSLQDSEITLKLCLKVIPLFYELSRIVGARPSLVCRMGYSKMVENYLMRKTRDFNLVIQKMPGREELSQRFRQTFKGGFVYEPKPGLYENIAVFDFKSLYPSIIVAHNVCPTTLNAKGKEVHTSPQIMINNRPMSFNFAKKPEGFIPSLVKDLIIKRDKVKNELKKEKKNSSEHAVLSARQNALKLLANASWGYLGFPQSRWYSLECSASITAWGRQYINNLIKRAELSNFKVTYGDTDSCFFILPKNDESIALDFAKKVNASLPEMMEVKFEGFFETGIFVSKKSEKRGAKKKYALYSKKEGMQIKGFEFVRRDSSIIAKELQESALKAILIEKNPKKALSLLKKAISDVKNNKSSIEKYAILTRMTKDSENYKNIGPHVAAVLKAKKSGKKILPGTLIEYVIASGKGKISENAYLLEQAKEKKLNINPDYYINNQLIPSVEEILKASGFSEKEFAEEKQKTLKGYL